MKFLRALGSQCFGFSVAIVSILLFDLKPTWWLVSIFVILGTLLVLLYSVLEATDEIPKKKSV